MESKDKVLVVREGVSARRNSDVEGIERLNDSTDNKKGKSRNERDCQTSPFFQIAMLVSGLSLGVSLCLAVLSWL